MFRTLVTVSLRHQPGTHVEQGVLRVDAFPLPHPEHHVG